MSSRLKRVTWSTHPEQKAILMNKLLFFISLIMSLLALATLYPGTAQGQARTGNIDVVLVIDNSGSMKENDPNNLRIAAAKLFIDLAGDNDKIGIVAFSDDVGTQKLTRRLMSLRDKETRRELKSLITTPVYGNETKMGQALELAYQLLNEDPEPNFKQFVVILSDGLPTPFESEDKKIKEVIDKFNPYWKIFPIALIGTGSGNYPADPAYLERELANRTEGQTFTVNAPEELINVYIDILALLQDDRYVDRVMVTPGGTIPLIEVLPDHQLAQLSFIVNRASGNTTHNLYSPDKKDMLRPDLKPIIYYAQEPEYEVFTIPVDQGIRLDGSWEMWLDGTDATEVVVMSRSMLRIRLSQPLSLDPEDDRARRYHPAGKPILIASGALEPKGNWAKGMSPVANLNNTTITLADTGGGYDLKGDDGLYTGVSLSPLPLGKQQISIEVPLPNSRPVHLVKTYEVMVESLPLLMMELPSSERNINDPVVTTISLKSDSNFTPDELKFLSVFVRRPDGQLVSLKPTDQEKFRYQLEYLPQASGMYTFTAIANIQAHDTQRKISYLDFAEATYESAVTTLLQIFPVSEDILEFSENGGVVSVQINSDSLQKESLNITAESYEWGDIDIKPSEVLVLPRDEIKQTFDLKFTKPAHGQGEILLKFSPVNPTVQLEDDRITWKVKIRSGFSGWLIILMAVCLIIGAGIFVYTRLLRK